MNVKLKKCPLKMLGAFCGSDEPFDMDESVLRDLNLTCDLSSCAWYDQHDKECCALSVTRHLHEITRRLEDLNPDGLEIEESETMEVYVGGDD